MVWEPWAHRTDLEAWKLPVYRQDWAYVVSLAERYAYMGQYDK